MSKKTFKDEFNPALQFISVPAETEDNAPKQNFQSISDDSVPMKRNPFYIETKSKRMQLLLQPSLHIKLKEMAEQKETSLNDLIHTILDNSTKI
jgi:predicted HicB family RNase H-like nuclease